MKLLIRHAAIALATVTASAACLLPPSASAQGVSGGEAEVAPPERLIVLVQPGASALAERFTAKDLPALEKLAAQMGVALSVVELTRGSGDAGGARAPEGVGITPLIVYQNHRGRSVYQGRYTTLGRVKNFVRTSRFLPQGSEALVREGLPVWDRGLAKVATPIKITALSGSVPEGFDAAGFSAEMLAAIGSADERFVLQDRAELGRSDRLFYTDFYPHRSEDGRLSLGLAVYSQFHCHDPVFTLMDGSLNGPWDDRREVFAQGYQRMTAEITRLLSESRLGDGFDVLPTGTAVVSWEALGLALPPKPEGASAEDLADVELGREWVMDQAAQEDRPAVQFVFPAPLDAYAGEVTSVTGELTLGEGLSIVAMRGRFVADPTSVTMGEPELDESIHTTMLDVAAHPESFFEIERVESEFDRPAFGVVAAAVMHGRFVMKGQTVALSVPVSIEAFLGDDGQPRLSIDGRWEVRLLDPFGIEGPPGKSPTNDTLIYTCHLVLTAADAP